MPKIAFPIDEKDRKILAELDKNARQSDSEIAKKVRISKQVANYRIQLLIKKGIISNFYTITNTSILGLNSYYVFLQLEKINKEKEIKLLERLSSLDYTGWVVNSLGRWELVLLVFAESINTFDKQLNEITNICGEHLHEYNFTTLVSSEHMGYKFIKKTESIEEVEQIEKLKEIKLSKTDRKILKNISQNARAPITEISEQIKIPIHTVNYHLKNLIKEKIITGFKPKININKLGYQWHLLLIQFQKLTKKRKDDFLNFCKNNKKVYYITNTVGLYNLMLDIHIKDIGELKELLLEIKENFSDIIKLYESITIFDEYKIDYFPEKIIS